MLGGKWDNKCVRNQENCLVYTSVWNYSWKHKVSDCK